MKKTTKTCGAPSPASRRKKERRRRTAVAKNAERAKRHPPPRPPHNPSLPKEKKKRGSSAGGTVTSPSSPNSSSPPNKKYAVKNLTLPFRAVKRIMKIDEDVATVQNEAAILVTHAAELFLKKMAKDSHQNAKSRARNTIRYEDVAEARVNCDAMGFLDTLIP
mmetsp:Transcript_16679/g.20804  ORF Transcript_16679/g.20804 Transcript_16679/m.20804 type:complete len:163 (-) Transcript_16679:150-638(-)